MFPRDMVCLRNISVDNLHKGDTEDDDDDDDDDDDNNNNNNNNNNKLMNNNTRINSLFRVLTTVNLLLPTPGIIYHVSNASACN